MLALFNMLVVGQPLAVGEAAPLPFPYPFGLSCRVVSVSDGIAVPSQTCWTLPGPPFALKTCANGTAFSPIVVANRTYTSYVDAHAKKAPYALMLDLSTTPTNVTGLTHIECKISEAPGGPAVAPATFVASLFGCRLGIMLSNDATNNPVLVRTFAGYNAYRYGPAFALLPARSKTNRPKLFPITDRFIAADDDAVNWAAGVTMLAAMGLSGLELEGFPSTSQQAVLEAAGLTFTSGAIYGPPPRSLDSPTELAAWATKAAAGLPSVGVPVRNFAMADEPGFYWVRYCACVLPIPSSFSHHRMHHSGSCTLAPPDVFIINSHSPPSRRPYHFDDPGNAIAPGDTESQPRCAPSRLGEISRRPEEEAGAV